MGKKAKKAKTTEEERLRPGYIMSGLEKYRQHTSVHEAKDTVREAKLAERQRKRAPKAGGESVRDGGSSSSTVQNAMGALALGDGGVKVPVPGNGWIVAEGAQVVGGPHGRSSPSTVQDATDGRVTAGSRSIAPVSARGNAPTTATGVEGARARDGRRDRSGPSAAHPAKRLKVDKTVVQSDVEDGLDTDEDDARSRSAPPGL